MITDDLQRLERILLGRRGGGQGNLSAFKFSDSRKHFKFEVAPKFVIKIVIGKIKGG